MAINDTSHFDSDTTPHVPDDAAAAFEAVIRRQGARPVTDLYRLAGLWPGDKDDGFEEAIRAMRQSGLIGVVEP